MSASHANRGKVFEEMLEAVHARHRRRGAYVQRNPTPYKVLGTIRGTPALRCVPHNDAPPDYLVGVDGMTFLADAKSCSGKRWSFSQLEAHQAEAFTRWQAQGPHHIAGVILWMRDAPRTADNWWLPWSRLKPLWERWAEGDASVGQASLTAADAAELGTAIRNWDWITAALAASETA